MHATVAHQPPDATPSPRKPQGDPYDPTDDDGRTSPYRLVIVGLRRAGAAPTGYWHNCWVLVPGDCNRHRGKGYQRLEDWSCPCRCGGNLTVTVKGDGRVLLWCHGGCSRSAVLSRLDLLPRHLFSQPNEPRDSTWRPDAIFDEWYWQTHDLEQYLAEARARSYQLSERFWQVNHEHEKAWDRLLGRPRRVPFASW
jgi:hypothetical protein